jgi:ATP-dependent helicase/nuclease subunit B
VEPGEQQGLSPARTLTVYPTALKARAALRAAARADGVLIGCGATTFPELTDVLARELGVTGRVLPPELAALVLEAAITDLPDLAGTLGGRGRGLLGELQGAIDELKGAGIGPGDLRNAVAVLPDFEAAIRVGELARIYQAYERRLARIEAVDRHGREWEVAERLAACVERRERPAVVASVHRVVFAEIYDFSVLQFLIATALIRLVGDAELVAFAHPGNVEATRFLERTWNRFVASEAIAEQMLPSFVARGGRQGSLAVVLRGLFAEPSPVPERGDGSIRVLAGPHRYGEVEAVLRDVRRRLEGGADPERVALVVRDLSPYAELLGDVARRFRVPVYFRRGTPLLASGAVREAVALVRCALEALPRARIAAIADSDYFRLRRPRVAALLEQLGYVSEAVCPLEACLEQAAARRGGEGERVRRAAARHQGALLAAAAAIRGLAGTRTFARHVQALRRTLRRLGFRPVGREALDGDAAARDARAWTRFEELLDGLAGVDRALGMAPVPLEEFLGLLVAAAALEAGSEPEGSGGVRALSVLDARGLDFDVVYVLGLDDGTFPAPRRESAVLPDALKRDLGRALLPVLRARLGERAAGLHGGLLRTAREAALEDPFLFFLALSMAEREVVLAYPMADERGNATVRSPFVDEVEGCLTEPLPVECADPAALVPAAEACCEEGELVARAAAERWRGPPPGLDRLTPALRGRVRDGVGRFADLDRRARVEAARLRYFLTPLASPERAATADAWVGLVPASPGLRARIDGTRWSPTRLEALAACGFKFFAGRVLGLGERERAAADVSGRERGALLHRVLEVLLGAMPAWPSDLDAARHRARALVNDRRASIETAVAPKERAVLDVEWERVLAVVDEIVATEVQEAQAAAAAGVRREQRLEWPFEFAFEEREGAPALRVLGTADRIDLWWRGEQLERLRVRDYKTARYTRTWEDRLADPAGGARRLAYQIPLYLEGALRAFGPLPATALEGGYWSLLAPGRQRERSRTFTAEGLRAVEEDVHALVTLARDGHFDVAPADCDVWCPYRAVCRYQPPPVEDDRG